ncbi:hypothetical protein [Porphyromonas gulae]|nr:hypothetical protein [Porphyromonas gulae]
MNDRYVLRFLSSQHSYSAGFVRPMCGYIPALRMADANLLYER